MQAMRRALAESNSSGAAQSAAQVREAIERFPKRQRVQATFYDPTKQHPDPATPAQTVSLCLAHKWSCNISLG